MKVAFLFSGQLRNIPVELFRNSLVNLTKDLNYDIYIYLWDDLGKSLNHSYKQYDINYSINPTELINQLFNGFNLKKIKYESFKKFQINMNKQYKAIYKSEKYHYGTINSMPQIYTLSKCFNLIDTLDEYELIFKCRFDSLFVHPLKLYDLKEISKNNNLYNLNFGRSYYPERIYDIFFGGSKHAMNFLSDIWEKFPLLLNDDFNNNLDKRDACRILYLAAHKADINVSSFDSRICDVFRNFKDNFYEKYLISMHLISSKNFFVNLYKLKYFFFWFKFRKFNLVTSLLYLVRSILISPLAYIKRLKYLRLKKILINFLRFK